jgi:hypothetical protein
MTITNNVNITANVKESLAGNKGPGYGDTQSQHGKDISPEIVLSPGCPERFVCMYKVFMLTA